MNGTLANVFAREFSYHPNVAWKNPVFFGVTKTMQEKWASLVKIENEMLLQIIIGDKPLSYFDEFVKTWLDLGGRDIINEVEEIVG
jgi:putative aldouronate transport system substrate-binding protein